MESALGLIIVLALFFLAGLGYKHRIKITRWLEDPDMLVARGNRIKVLQRRIEDAQDELDELNAKGEKKE